MPPDTLPPVTIQPCTRLERSDSSEFACGRAYYAMFHLAEALLAEVGESFRKHSGVHAAFGRRFAMTGALDSKLHCLLLDAYDARVVGDYGVEAELSLEDSRLLIERAREFLATGRAFDPLSGEACRARGDATSARARP